MADISQAFIEQYNTDVLNVLQREMPKFPSMARQGTVQGSTAYWQRFGTLSTQTKAARGDRLTATALDHTRKSVTIEDHYVYTEIDDLDLLKINVDERQAHARGHVAALNRKKDDICLSAWIAGAGGDLGPGDTNAMDLATALSLMEYFGDNHVPDDGRRFVGVSPKTWSQLLQISQFANADYIGQGDLPFLGATAKRWLTFTWFIHPTVDDTTPAEASIGGLPANATTNVVKNVAWHADMVGYAGQLEPRTQWDWENDLFGWSCASAMALGACVLEPIGVQVVSTDQAA